MVNFKYYFLYIINIFKKCTKDKRIKSEIYLKGNKRKEIDFQFL